MKKRNNKKKKNIDNNTIELKKKRCRFVNFFFLWILTFDNFKWLLQPSKSDPDNVEAFKLYPTVHPCIYFAESVVQDQPAHTRNFFMKSSTISIREQND